MSLESHPRGNRTLSGRHREDPEPAASARAKAKHTQAGPTLGRRSAIGEAIDSQRWGSKDSICLPPTSHPRPGAAEPGCQSQSQAPGLCTAHSFRRVSRQRNFHVFAKSEKVGDGTVGDSHLGNTGSSESSCDCSLRSFVSISRLHCLLGYRRTQIPPLSALEDEPNSSALPKEADGHKRQLLVPKLQFLMESIQRKEVYSGSLCQSP